MSLKAGDVYRAEAEVLKAPAGDVDMEGVPVPTGCLVKIETMYVVDLTTANKTMRLGYERAGVKYWVRREAPGATVYGLGMVEPLILGEGEKPICRVESATASDECRFFARGVYL